MTSFTTNSADFATIQPKRSFGQRVLDMLARIAEANPKYIQAQHLASLSDEQLAKLGMTRADIPSRVWGSRFI